MLLSQRSKRVWLFPLMSQPLSPYVDPESGLLIQALDASAAFELVGRMPCLVHLLPAFRMGALTKFAKGEKDTYLSGSCPKDGGSSAARNGLVLYRCVLSSHISRCVVAWHS